MDKREIGILGEKYAAKFLTSQNYQIICKNFRKRIGEIDLVALDQEKNELVFVEVKTRTSDKFGAPQDSVNRQKQQKLLKTALHFLNSSTQKYSSHWRVDVVAVNLDLFRRRIKFNHFKNILDGA